MVTPHFLGMKAQTQGCTQRSICTYSNSSGTPFLCYSCIVDPSLLPRRPGVYIFYVLKNIYIYYYTLTFFLKKNKAAKKKNTTTKLFQKKQAGWVIHQKNKIAFHLSQHLFLKKSQFSLHYITN
jgi:hypothetical protein